MCWKDRDGECFSFWQIQTFHVQFRFPIICEWFNDRATGRRSNESIELQPLHVQKGPKGVLRRMPRVRSDEIHETSADQQALHVHEKDKTPSPIGAGLPLLQRLRLLKEKQVSSDSYVHSFIHINLSFYIELDSVINFSFKIENL